MNHNLPRLLLVNSLLCATALAGPPPLEHSGRVPHAPPPAPPVIENRDGPGVPRPDGPHYGPQIWSIGQPSDEEQLYLEFINRARANPPQEGQRLAATTDPEVLSAYDFFNVDLALMQQQFNAIAAAPPLAMNAQLLIAARLHSGDMFTNQFQGHVSSTGKTLEQRVQAQGGSYSTLGENVYAYAESVWHGHAGFNVDWGPGPGGMQTPPGHRNSIHNANFREVGIGVVNGVNGSVGPQVVTEDFGTRQNAGPLVTGVVYFDFNGNNFYDLGEGIGGITVDLPGSAYHAVTPDSGGYAVPVSSNATYVVNFSGPNVAYSTTATVSSLRNVKVDYVPAYTPPVISGPNPAALNSPNVYTFTPVPGATGFDWRYAIRVPYTTVEGAESLAGVTITSAGGYAFQASDIKFAGSYSFHFAHPSNDSGPPDEVVTLNASFQPSASSQLTFYKRLGWASTTQVARAQVSTDNGATWTDVWTQAGNNNSTDQSFSQVTVPLNNYAGSTVRLRFVYDFAGGSYFPQVDAGVGLYLDNIAVSGATQQVDPVVASETSATSFAFVPNTLTNYVLSVRPRVNGRTLNWGPEFEVSVTQSLPAPVVHLLGAPTVTATQAQVDFEVTNYRSGITFELWRTSSLPGGWAVDPGATLTTLLPNSVFRLTTSTPGAQSWFYRVRASW